MIGVRRVTLAAVATTFASATMAAPALAEAPVPVPEMLAAALQPALDNPGLGQLTGIVSDAQTGQTLWQQHPESPRVPASVTKLLTAAAALLTLPADQRATTQVVHGFLPGQLVLVGAGDPTVTAQPTGSPGFFTDAAHLDDLVNQIRQSGAPVSRLAVDKWLFWGPTMAQGWDPSDIEGGSIAPIESTMLDGGRLDPLTNYSPRTDDPALDLGRTLAKRLDLDPSTVSVGVAPPGAPVVASVQSAPLSDRVREMLLLSDNVLAESLGREIARAQGALPTFDGAVTAVTGALRDAGFDTTGLTLHDLSGLSTEDRVPAMIINQILTAAAGPDRPQLRPLLEGLPVAGRSGTLATRFTGPNAAAAGWVKAKTGTLTAVNSLAGIVTDTDNRVLTFTLMSSGTAAKQARPALDGVAVVLRGCGCR